MKYVIKVENLQNLPKTRPLIAMDVNGKFVCKPKLNGNKIWYTTTDNEIYDLGGIIETIVSTSEVTYNGPAIVSNEFDEEKQMWCMTFDRDVTVLGIVDIESEHPTMVGPIFSSIFEGLTCNVKTIILPETVTSIEYGAFGGCEGLTSIEIPNSVTSIGDGAFYECTGLTSVTIPNSVISIGDSAFAECSSLTSIKIPNSVISIGNSAFAMCTGLTSVKISNSVTSIGYRVFGNCTSLTSIEIPNSVTIIGQAAFNSCDSLTSIEIPNSVTSIEDGAFSQCSNLVSVTIPNSVTSIGDMAFKACTGLTSIICKATTPPTGSEGIFVNTNDCPIYVPSESVDVYRTSWPTYSDRIVGLLNDNQIKYVAHSQLTINDGMEYAEHTFDDETGIGIVTFYNNLTVLGDNWFTHTFENHTDNIKLLTLPNNVSEIYMTALAGAPEVYYEGTQKECARIDKSIDGIGVEEIHCFDGIVIDAYISNKISPILLAQASWFRDLLGKDFIAFIMITASLKIYEYPETITTAGEFIDLLVNGTPEIPGLSTYGFTAKTATIYGVTTSIALHTESGHAIGIAKATDYTDINHFAPVAENESLDPDYMYILLDDTIIKQVSVQQ